MKTIPIGSIRLSGGRVYHESDAMLVVYDSEEAIRGTRGLVTLKHARGLVDKSQAVWTDKPRGERS